ncbi:thioredoxin family protein [Bacillus cereus]|uniref:thioredoxin family protein n=1 Tax=Bacillus cereus group TaxID=86661 RepID=UPI001443D383|nr:thioredoxin family protein [Bacillus cereus]NKW77398.1 thioredoxin family protein [Bacillus cereus]NKX14815.1 thioredoxin family protein [Bacillus cereus]
MIQIIDFYRDGCEPCNKLSVELDKVKEAYGDKVVIDKINAETHPDIAAAHGIMGVPVIKMYVGEEVVYQGKGYHPYELLEAKIEENL